jgi:hypothetical protein
MKTTVYTTVVQNCITDSLYSVPNKNNKKKTDLGAWTVSLFFLSKFG